MAEQGILTCLALLPWALLQNAARGNGDNGLARSWRSPVLLLCLLPTLGPVLRLIQLCWLATYVVPCLALHLALHACLR